MGVLGLVLGIFSVMHVPIYGGPSGWVGVHLGGVGGAGRVPWCWRTKGYFAAKCVGFCVWGLAGLIGMGVPAVYALFFYKRLWSAVLLGGQADGLSKTNHRGRQRVGDGGA